MCVNRSGKIGEEQNILCSDIICKKITKLLIFFPVWSRLIYSFKNDFDISYQHLNMNPILNRFSTTLHEKVFEQNEHLYPHEFIEKHGLLLKELAAKNRKPLECSNSQLLDDDKDIKDDTIHSYLDFRENWKNKLKLDNNDVDVDEIIKTTGKQFLILVINFI